ncbi:C-GCAxxG-C-C family protein [Eubacteriales bacterium OttesenSCG-928-K08]|nr:C-GCAxxG-C-C family protein [Eubacteriales bacterium OttesenSCG-928-K08]
MAKATQAVECFHSGFNCAQAVFSTYSEEFGLDKETALKLSCGLGAGMGRLGHVCGAVSGAYLVIGLKYGQFQPNDKEEKEKTYAMVQEFSKRFEERNGTTICRDLLGVDLLQDDKVFTAERIKEVCPKMVQDATEIIEELLF